MILGLELANRQGPGFCKEPVPAPAFLSVQIRALDDGLTEGQERLHQQGRKRQVIGPVDESMLGPLVLWKRCDTSKPLGATPINIFA